MWHVFICGVYSGTVWQKIWIKDLDWYRHRRMSMTPHSRSVCFAEKPSVKIVFHIFQCLVAQKKPGQWKTIFGQQKTLIKIRLIFHRLFSKNFFWKTISLSHVASPINIIFVYSRGKHNFLAPSLSHGKFSHFFSPHTFTVTNSSLSSSHRSLSLSLFSLFSMFLFPSVMQFSN